MFAQEKLELLNKETTKYRELQQDKEAEIRILKRERDEYMTQKMELSMQIKQLTVIHTRYMTLIGRQ